MKRLKVTFSPKGFMKPIYSSLSHEVGEMTFVTDDKGKGHEVYIVSDEAMTPDQADLFFYLWKKVRSKSIKVEGYVLYAINLASKVCGIENAKEVLESYRESERIKREQRTQAQFEREYRRLNMILATL